MRIEMGDGLLQVLVKGFNVGLEGCPLPTDLVRRCSGKLDQAARMAAVIPDKSRVSVLDLEPEEAECIKMCFEVGAEGTSDVPDADWHQVLGLLSGEPAAGPKI